MLEYLLKEVMSKNIGEQLDPEGQFTLFQELEWFSSNTFPMEYWWDDRPNGDQIRYIPCDIKQIFMKYDLTNEEKEFLKLKYT